MNLRRLLASMRDRRRRAKSPETGQIVGSSDSIDPGPQAPAASEEPNPRVRLILEGGVTVPLEETERLEYLAENLLRAHERPND